MNVAQAIAYGVAVLGVIAGARGYYGQKRGDSIIAYQAKDNAAIKSYNQTLETEKAALITERDNWKQQAEVFKRAAQGSPQLIKLTNEIKNLTQAVTSQTNQMTAFLKRDNNGKDAR